MLLSFNSNSFASNNNEETGMFPSLKEGNKTPKEKNKTPPGAPRPQRESRKKFVPSTESLNLLFCPIKVSLFSSKPSEQQQQQQQVQLPPELPKLKGSAFTPYSQATTNSRTTRRSSGSSPNRRSSGSSPNCPRSQSR